MYYILLLFLAAAMPADLFGANMRPPQNTNFVAVHQSLKDLKGELSPAPVREWAQRYYNVGDELKKPSGSSFSDTEIKTWVREKSYTTDANKDQIVDLDCTHTLCGLFLKIAKRGGDSELQIYISNTVYHSLFLNRLLFTSAIFKIPSTDKPEDHVRNALTHDTAGLWHDASVQYMRPKPEEVADILNALKVHTSTSFQQLIFFRPR